MKPPGYTIEETYRGATAPRLHSGVLSHPQVDTADRLMHHLAIVAATPDGEDSAGRQKMRPLTPNEIVERATNIAAAAWEEYEKRGWLIDLPDPTPQKSKTEL